MVDRGSNHYGNLGLAAHELEAVTRLSPEEIHLHGDTLQRHRLAYFEEDEDHMNVTVMWVKTYGVDGWDFWASVREFCQAKGLECKRLINEPRFDLLDQWT